MLGCCRGRYTRLHVFKWCTFCSQIGPWWQLQCFIMPSYKHNFQLQLWVAINVSRIPGHIGVMADWTLTLKSINVLPGLNLRQSFRSVRIITGEEVFFLLVICDFMVFFLCFILCFYTECFVLCLLYSRVQWISFVVQYWYFYCIVPCFALVSVSIVNEKMFSIVFTWLNKG